MNISGELPFEPMWSLQISGNSSTLYVGADDGVYRSTDTGVTWNRFGKKLPNAQVYQLELSSSLHILGAATHGRSMWEIKADLTCIFVRAALDADACRHIVCDGTAPAPYWAGVAGGGSGLASVRTSFIFPVRSSNTCMLGTILQSN